MAYKAVVAYSFGGSHYGPGCANVVLAQIAARVSRETDAALLVQDYLEIPIQEKGIFPNFIVREHREKGKFLGTEEVTLQFAEYLRRHNISKVLLVAHPFLHWRKCKKLLQQEGFDVKCVPTGKVPFDRSNESWWVRGPFHLLLYALLQLVVGRQGH